MAHEAENSDGAKYLEVNKPFPGQTYFLRRVDESNQIYYVQAQLPGLSHSNTPQTMLDNDEVYRALDLHYGITITSIFIPTLIYLIGFPFCFVSMRRLVQKKGDAGELKRHFSSYSGVGWFTWIIHLSFLISLCTFYIPYCTLDNYYSYNYYRCSIWPGIITLFIAASLCFVFTVTIAILGSILAKNLLRMSPSESEYHLM